MEAATYDMQHKMVTISQVCEDSDIGSGVSYLKTMRNAV
jgi:hypothetical protein